MRSLSGEATQQTGDMSLAPAMNRSRRRTHKDAAMLIGPTLGHTAAPTEE